MHPCFTPVIHYLLKRPISDLKTRDFEPSDVEPSMLSALKVEPSPYGDYRSCEKFKQYFLCFSSLTNSISGEKMLICYVLDSTTMVITEELSRAAAVRAPGSRSSYPESALSRDLFLGLSFSIHTSNIFSLVPSFLVRRSSTKLNSSK